MAVGWESTTEIGGLLHDARKLLHVIFDTGGGVFLCSLFLPANTNAADLGAGRNSIKDSPMAYYSSGYNWTGLYGGVFLGGVTETWNVDFYRNNNHGHANIGSAGLAYGAMLGYNMMLDNKLVVGLEGDFGTANASQSNNIFDNDTSYSTISSFGSLRGRFGYAMDRLLIYGTAGFAFGKITNDIQKGRNAGEEIVYDDKWQNGYVVGGGAEYAITGNLLARIEYLYSNYGMVTLRNQDGNLTELTNDMHQVRLGLAYKF